MMIIIISISISIQEDDVLFVDRQEAPHLYIHGSVHRDSILIRSNEVQQNAGVYLL